MSNDDRDIPEFDDLDLPDEMFQPGDQTAQPMGEMIEPTEGTPPPGFDAGDAPTADMAGPLPPGLEGKPGGDDEGQGKKKKKKKKREGTGESLFQRLRTASPYTVMLAISLAAILVAILCLLLELNAYDLDIKAKDAKQRVSFHTAPAAQSGPPSTIAAA